MDDEEINFWLINSMFLFLFICCCLLIIILMYVKRIESVCLITGCNMINNVGYLEHVDSLRCNGLIY